MRFRFVVDGPKYSKHKEQFKAILREHRLAWKGNMTTYVWASGKERVLGEFERDPARDVTVRATLIWEGRAKTPFLNQLKTWVFSLGGQSSEEKRPKESATAAKERVERELEVWDVLHKPGEEALRAEGRPQAWIERDLRAWKKARDARRKELLRP
jgi:hypothetical protein